MAKKLMALKADKDQENLDHQRLKTLINSMADAVITVDEQVKIATYNAAALNLLDVNNIAAGLQLEKIFAPEDKNNQPVDITNIIKHTDIPTSNRDYKLKYKDGSTVSLYTSIAPVRLGYGERGTRGFVILLRDISREKSLEEERDEFISVVSHELRTPIAITEGNIGNAEFIVEKSGDINQVKKALKEAHSQVLFLADLINDLSTLSRAERNILKVEVEPINVVSLINELANNYLSQCKAKGLNLKTDLDPHLEVLTSSKLYVREILQNFITNSIKYTSEGYITIGARAEDKGVKFSISDTGIGISKGDQEKVFDKFFRSEDYRTRQSNGTGLGLYVTIKLTRLIHAEVNLESELNKGSTFTVYVPNLSSE
jgi:two-component system, OmpR family, phosphate regulon sensor histidine kinase PhoR